MGEVYRARDLRLKRDVAIKVLPDAFTSDAERLARFEREAQLLAAVNHPNIAAIYGIEEADGTRALVLELVEGVTLAERLVDGPLPCASALDVARQIAFALEAAHDRGVIHRDLKPANIKLAPGGAVKVLDFGLAKALDAPSGPQGLSDSPTEFQAGTRLGVVLGTLGYMSPEQARGAPLDARTDVWAFGCVLFEILTGRSAFGGDTATDVLAAVVAREPDWDLLPAATPARVVRLIRRCLAKDLRRRLRHIGDARLELEELDDEPAPRESRVLPMHAWIGWGVAGLAGLALVAISSGPPRLRMTSGLDAPRVTRAVRLTSGPAHESAPALSPDGKWVAYLSNARGATDVWVKFIAAGEAVNLTATAGLDLPAQADIGGLAITPDGTGILFDAGTEREGTRSYGSWIVPAPLGGVPRRFLGRGRGVRWSPDGTRIAYVMAGGAAGDALWVADGDGNNARELASRRGGIHRHWPAWSMDGRSVYFNYSVSSLNAEPVEIYRLPADGGSAEPTVVTVRRAMYPVPMPDGKSLVYAANPDTSELALWWRPLADPAAPSVRLTSGVGEYSEPHASADGRRVVSALVDVRQSLEMIPINGRGASTPLSSGFTGDLDPTLSRDGQRLVFSSTRSGNRNLWSANPDGTAASPLTSGLAIDERPAISPDGRQIAFLSDRGGARGIWLIDTTGGAARQLAKVVAFDSLSWSADGSRLVFATQGDASALQVLTVADGRITTVPTPGSASAPAWSPVGDVIAYLASPASGATSGPPRIAFVTAAGAPLPHSFPAPNLGNGMMAWNSAGTLVAVAGNSGSVASELWVFDPAGRQPGRRVATFPHNVRLRGITWTRADDAVIVGQARRTGDIVLFELDHPR
jgi:Tol biopolymer transport system component